MADFKQAIPYILQHEGGFTETAAGEVVNRGVNTDTLKALGYQGTKDELKEIVRNLTVEETEDIYRRFYWTLPKPSLQDALDRLTSQKVANKILDMMVLSGQHTTIKLVQRALSLKEDMIWGHGTLTKANEMGDDLVLKLSEIWTAYLSGLADKKIENAKTDQLKKYWTQVKTGWVARAGWDGNS